MAPTVLTVNTGSSSVRLAAYRGTDLLASAHDPQGEPTTLLRAFLQTHALEHIDIVAHRVVHGGPHLLNACVIDAQTEAEIDRLAPFAPLHNPIALAWIRACRDALGATQVAVFDTAFYAALPAVAATYALPQALCAQHGIRRYGFHGLAHQAMWKIWQAHHPDQGKVISLQLGSGCSITATQNGQPLDTSMGFSPLEGLVMATRCGDVDPGIILFLQGNAGLSLDHIEDLLNRQSGLLGISGLSADLRVLLGSQTTAAQLAVDLYCYRARKYIGAYLSVLGGADAILFGGGVGENAPLVRQRILADMAWAGIVLDPERNAKTIAVAGRISADNSNTAVWVTPVDEASILAGEAIRHWADKSVGGRT